MSREIKFRGKGKEDSRMHFGSYAYFPCLDIHIILCRKGKFGDQLQEVEIDPDTLGQYTGLKDINVIDIYENDKVKNNNGKIREVGFNSNRSQFGLYNKAFDCWITNELLSDGWEIIGNIHEVGI